MSRTTMATLIGYVRDMINDPAGASATWSDDQIQQRLDESRSFVNYSVLRVEPTLGSLGVLSMCDFYADVGYWEDAPATQLYTPAYVPVTPLEADTLTGHWRFDSTPPGQPLPVLVRGFYYDVYAASAGLLTRWAAKVAMSYDISSGSQRLSRSQMRAGLLELAGEYRRKARPRTIPMVREDEAEGQWPTQNDNAFPWTW